jgi:hypothetical protein
MRVIADLVVNHTSDQHPWFQASKSSSRLPYRDWYVWRDRPPEDGPKGEVFPGEQNGVWTKHRGTGQYYLHRFYPHQPDLNVTNPAVRDEIARILGFWMELGLSGFRVDAVPFLLETEGTADPTALSDPHDFLRDLRAFMHRRNGESVLLGEVNLPYQESSEPSSARTPTSSRCASTSSACRRCTSRSHDATPRRSPTPSRPPGRPPRGTVGHVRPQPRRADARQADQVGAPGGLRRVRSRRGHADLRSRPPPAAATHARR